MPEISILPEFLINKIAAGEVIERPASVVRELIDNSIDASAKKISVEIVHGGKKLIKVIDDGEGMDRKNASLCFERHATSKIKSEDDLFNIFTLGFRGEALPAIASVSKVTMITSQPDSPNGTKIETRAGYERLITDAPAWRGTCVEVRDIFYNTPARRKFLKSVSTELSHIIDVIMQKALSYPEMSFSLIHNGRDIISVPEAGSRMERFIQLYGEELSNEFFDASEEGDGIKLYGFFSFIEFARATRSYQYIFVNRRAVKNPTVSHAVYNAYSSLIPKDRHPAFFLFLDINPGKVDVNVHPVKREVRFDSPEEIHKLITLALNKNLSKDSHVTGMQGYTPSYEWTETRGPFAVHDSTGFQTDILTYEAVPHARYFYIGESFIAEITEGGLTIIDQHAAHERILYEKFLKKTSIEVESLLFPARIELPAREYNVIMSHKKLLHDFGLDFDEFGLNNVIVRSMPRELLKADIKGLLLDIASGILEEHGTGKEKLMHTTAARLACHKAVRGDEGLKQGEIIRLLSELEKTEMSDRCPHGRPTRIHFSIRDLRRLFKRE
ncbi:MAG TPA: DNA mismatch repair endonuclease MutL [Nitrospiraceae bacterium]|nr:DNA mismatch repair endonuclease MutL [Nitrospiraceae bacterium]